MSNYSKQNALYQISESILKGEVLPLHEDIQAIAAAVGELKVGDKTNFGVITAIGDDSVTFKAKDLPPTKIKFNGRKIGSTPFSPCQTGSAVYSPP